jgi:hypothetical protein
MPDPVTQPMHGTRRSVTDEHLPDTTRPIPRHVRYAIRALFLVAAIHLVALALVITHHDVLTASVAAHHPGWSPHRVDRVASSQFQSTMIPHVVLPIVFVTRARALRSGRRRTRTIITALLGLQLLAHATLPLQLQLFPGYGQWIIAIQAVSLTFEASTIYLLWRSPEARSFFAPTSNSAVGWTDQPAPRGCTQDGPQQGRSRDHDR